MSQSLIDEIESYLAPRATYHNWRPSMETMRELVEALRNPLSATPDRSAIIEECAKVCEQPRGNASAIWTMGTVRYDRANELLRQRAQAIRALKESAAPQAGRTVEP